MILNAWIAKKIWKILKSKHSFLLIFGENIKNLNRERCFYKAMTFVLALGLTAINL